MTEEDDIDGLAAEYVLGSLSPTERAEVEARRGSDAALATAIEAWCRSAAARLINDGWQPSSARLRHAWLSPWCGLSTRDRRHPETSPHQ